MIQSAETFTEKFAAAIVPMPLNRAGKLWRPLHHGDLISAIRKAVKGRGWSLKRPHVYLSSDGADLAVSWDVLCPLQRQIGTHLSIGFRNSNSRTVALSVFGGIRTAEGPVVMFMAKLGQHRAGRAGGVDAITGAVTQWEAVAENLASEQFELETELTKDEPSILLKAGDAKLMPWSRLSKVHEDYKKRSSVRWGLLSAFGMHLGRNPPLEQMRQGYGFYRLVKGDKKP